MQLKSWSPDNTVLNDIDTKSTEFHRSMSMNLLFWRCGNRVELNFVSLDSWRSFYGFSQEIRVKHRYPTLRDATRANYDLCYQNFSARCTRWISKTTHFLRISRRLRPGMAGSHSRAYVILLAFLSDFEWLIPPLCHHRSSRRVYSNPFRLFPLHI